jgi:hypothetical protein
MPTAVERILEQIEADADTWSFEEQEEQISKNIANLNFLGELEKSNFYVYMLITMRNVETGRSRPVTEEEAEEFYATGTVSGRDDYVTDRALCIYYNLDRPYLRAYVDQVNRAETPKQAYVLAFTRIKEFMGVSNSPNLHQRIVDSSYKYAQPWLDLKKILEYARDGGNVKLESFKKKIIIHKTKYFHDIKSDMRDDEYSATGASYIPLPQAYKKTTVDEKVVAVLNGASFSEPFFRDDVTKRFDLTVKAPTEADYTDQSNNFDQKAYDEAVATYETRVKDYDNKNKTNMYNFLYSLIDYINAHPEYDQKITGLQKTDYSHKWIREGTRDEDDNEIPASTNHYEVRVCKVKSKILIEAEAWDSGTVFIVTNKMDEDGSLGDSKSLG